MALRCLLTRAPAFLPRSTLAESGLFPHLFSRLNTSDGSDSITSARQDDDGITVAGDQSSVAVVENSELSSLTSTPRVANLPEDLTQEQLDAIRAASGDDESPTLAKRLLEKKIQADQLPLPQFTKSAQNKKKEPVPLMEAIKELKANAKARFDETVEAHVRLGIDPRRSDQVVRGAATLPHGTGKVVRVAVFAEGITAQEAQEAGADIVGADDLISMIQESGGKLNFDKCIATPAFMPRLGKVARILGPRGLMPNPKVGTVTNNVGEAVRSAKQGLVAFKADKTAIVHAGLGKVSFKDEALLANIAAFTGALLNAKPSASRYVGYVNSFTLSSTMGPGIRVTIQSLAQAADNFTKSVEAR